MTRNHSKPLTPLLPSAPHHRVGQRRPGQQEEAEEGHDPAVEGAAEQVAEEPQREQRQPRRDQGEEDDEAADGQDVTGYIRVDKARTSRRRG